jgi:hypothetical protein
LLLNFHHLFVTAESIAWFFFWPSKICVSSTGIISSLFALWCHLSSGRRRHAVAPCHASFPWSQDDIITSISTSGNTSSRRSTLEPKPKDWICIIAAGHPLWTTRLPPSTTIKGHLNLDHSPHHSQLRLYFAFSLARAPHHRSFTRRRHSLSLTSHVHRPAVQQHP